MRARVGKNARTGTGNATPISPRFCPQNHISWPPSETMDL